MCVKKTSATNRDELSIRWTNCWNNKRTTQIWLPGNRQHSRRFEWRYRGNQGSNRVQQPQVYGSANDYLSSSNSQNTHTVDLLPCASLSIAYRDNKHQSTHTATEYPNGAPLPLTQVTRSLDNGCLFCKATLIAIEWQEYTRTGVLLSPHAWLMEELTN